MVFKRFFTKLRAFKSKKLLISVLIVCLVCFLGILITQITNRSQKFTIIFDLNGDTKRIPPQQIRFNQRVKRPNDISIEKHIFLGWYEDPFFIVEYSFDKPTKSNIVLYGKLAKAYTAQFETQSDYKIDDVLVQENMFLKRPQNPTRLGFEFENWYTSYDYKTVYDFYIRVTTDIKLFAKWKRVFYVVSFISDTTIVQNVSVGQKVLKPSNPKRDGYTFHDWYTDFNYSVRFDFDDNIKDDITLYALFIKNDKDY